MRFVSWITIVGMLLSSGLLLAQDARVDFSGEWTLNADRSEMGGGPGGGGRGDRGGRRGMGSFRMVVEQTGDKLIVHSYRLNREGDEIVSTSTYTLDGKECENSSEFRTEVSAARRAKDGKSLIINSTVTMSRGDREFTWESSAIWSQQGENLVIESVRSTPRGERESKAVYDRVKE
jgi:hypothetical protein